ncbi:MAG: hypothetical protein AAB426_15350, partial [Myxococcota bacterium]
MLRASIAIVAVFVTWSLLDFVIHSLMLGSVYAATPELWRPMGEMKMGLMYATVLIAAAAFVAIYARFVSPKSLGTATLYGLVFGIGTGISMGYGSYSVMPIPYTLAIGWF